MFFINFKGLLVTRNCLRLMRASLNSLDIRSKILRRSHFFSIWVFFHDHSRITGPQGKGKGISLSPQYHFHPLHRHLRDWPGDYSRELTSAQKRKSLTTKLHALKSVQLEITKFKRNIGKTCIAKLHLSEVSVKKVRTPVLDPACNFIKKRLQHRCFPVKFAKFLRKKCIIITIIFVCGQTYMIHSFSP